VGVWNNLHITADIIFRPTMTHVVISLRGQLDIQRQALRHDKIFLGCLSLLSSSFFAVTTPSSPSKADTFQSSFTGVVDRVGFLIAPSQLGWS
jgi:hypothetical protein